VLVFYAPKGLSCPSSLRKPLCVGPGPCGLRLEGVLRSWGPFSAPSVDAPSTPRCVGYARCLRARAGPSPLRTPPRQGRVQAKPDRGAARCKHWMDRRTRSFATGGRTRPTGSVGRTAVSGRQERSSRTRISPGGQVTGSGWRTTGATATGGGCARGWRKETPPDAGLRFSFRHHSPKCEEEASSEPNQRWPTWGMGPSPERARVYPAPDRKEGFGPSQAGDEPWALRARRFPRGGVDCRRRQEEDRPLPGVREVRSGV
jgi:hypothetical protein